MKQYFWWLALLVPALFFESCIKPGYEPSPTPEDFPLSETTLVDTFTLNPETYIIDSLNSTGQNYLMAGGFNGYLGNITARSYFQFLPQNYNVKYPDSVVIDSTVLLFRSEAGANYGGASETDLSDFYLKELNSDLNGDRSYYTFSKFTDVKPDVVISFGQADRKGTVYRKRIDSWGQKVMDQWKGVEMFHNDQQFLSYFHGFELTSSSDKRVTRFDLKDSSTVVTSGFYVYCHVTDGVVTSAVNYYFKVNSGTVQFYNIDVVRTGLWTQLQPKVGLPASQTNGKVAVQSGTALATKIRIPGISNWIKTAGKVKIFSAELIVTPDAGTSFVPPDYIRLTSQENYYSDFADDKIVYNESNILNLQKLNPSLGLTRAAAKQYASTRVFAYNATANEYRCNITTHVQDMVDGINNSTHLNLYSADLSTSLRQMLITQTALEKNLKLRVYYYKI